MRIAIIAGYSRSLINFRGPLIRALVAAGHEVRCCGPEDDDEVKRTLAEWGVGFRAVPMARAGLSPGGDVAYWLRLRRWFADWSLEVVLAYTHKAVIYGSLAARVVPGCRVYALITGLGYAFIEQPGLKSRLVRRILLRLYRAAARQWIGVFFQNPDDEALFRQLGVVPPSVPSKIVRGSGVDLNQFVPASLPGGQRFLLIARLLKDKGIQEYVEAARRLREEFPEAEWHLVGPIDPNPAAITLPEVEEWTREGIIQYHGSQSDVRPFLRNCDVYVLPSYREGTPRTVLEAMAMGRPVITTDAPGCRETVFDARSPNEHGIRWGVNGALVTPRSVESLTAAMRTLLLSPERREDMGLASRRLAEEYYDVDKVNREMLAFMGLS